MEEGRSFGQIPEHEAYEVSQELNQLFLQAQEFIDQLHQNDSPKATLSNYLVSLPTEDVIYNAATSDRVGDHLEVTQIYDSCPTMGLSCMRAMHRES